MVVKAGRPVAAAWIPVLLVGACGQALGRARWSGCSSACANGAVGKMFGSRSGADWSRLEQTGTQINLIRSWKGSSEWQGQESWHSADSVCMQLLALHANVSGVHPGAT